MLKGKNYYKMLFFLILPLIYTNQLVLRGLTWHSEYLILAYKFISVGVLTMAHSVMSMAWTWNIMSCEGTYSFRWDSSNYTVDMNVWWSVRRQVYHWPTVVPGTMVSGRRNILQKRTSEIYIDALVVRIPPKTVGPFTWHNVTCSKPCSWRCVKCHRYAPTLMNLKDRIRMKIFRVSFEAS